MERTVYTACLGCLAGAALTVFAAGPATACEAHDFLSSLKTTLKTAVAGSSHSRHDDRAMMAGPQSEKTGSELAEAMKPVMAMDAWVPLAPPGLKTHAGYLVLMNKGEEKRAVTAVSSPQYKSAMLHLSAMKDGVAMMQHLAQVEIPAGGQVAFKPHGLHIMLMGPKGPQAEGDTVDLNFTLDDGSTLSVAAKVMKRADAPAPMDHGAMGHDHKGM